MRSHGPSLADLAREMGVRDERVLEAIHDVPRATFVPQGLVDLADEDVPVPSEVPVGGRVATRGGPLAVGPGKGLGNMSSWAMARDVSVTMRVQPLRAPMPDTTATAAMNFPARVVGEHGVEGVDEGRPGAHEGVVRHQAHHDRRHQHVEQRTGRRADHRGAHHVAPRILDPLGRDRRRLDPDEGEERHARCDPDAAVEAAARGVEGAEVARGHEGPAHDADEEEREELEDDGDVLEPGHLADSDQVDDGRHPQTERGDEPFSMPVLWAHPKRAST